LAGGGEFFVVFVVFVVVGSEQSFELVALADDEACGLAWCRQEVAPLCEVDSPPSRGD
jgi:hypothetical protein